ncbi:pe-pgrs family protein [Candidatus Burkholderia pumila]|uniref:Pe-pgrs family protein n=1 Tax=Candidatus Burkholderia pumila TaxID=1090375 RepID=A0ABR5HLR5_9BURK|nr:pe-pgrs family protein [Candidatus Burkholderia pumila]
MLPYYNAANPSQAFNYLNNSGASQGTTRSCQVALALTAGVPATAGSQQVPATPAGQTALYTVTVAYGATTVTSANIAKVSSAPFSRICPAGWNDAAHYVAKWRDSPSV